jgi:glycine/D-amino acid oxidase-like deaminating enzyme
MSHYNGTPDLVVVGAGIVGAACAHFAAREGLSVTVVDRGAIAGGTTGRGEGNILVSDKEPGPELDLALLSNRLWFDVAGAELQRKGGLLVFAGSGRAQPEPFFGVGEHAPSGSGHDDLVTRQRAAGVEAVAVPADELHSYEPNLAADLAGAYYYPQDLQVQPMLATARLLQGLDVRTHTPVVGLLRAGDRVTGVRTAAGDIPAGAVLNAAGTWSAEIAAMAGVDLPVAPRRGFVLVTEPLRDVVRHKVYLADYLADVASDAADLQCSPVVESTPAGTILIGASRERVGFDGSVSMPALRQLATGAIRLFPMLRDVAALRVYRGFRPYCPDHLPVIGPDPRAPGLWHATGHEGAGIGLSLGTGRLVAQALTDAPPDLDLDPFRPERFEP